MYDQNHSQHQKQTRSVVNKDELNEDQAHAYNLLETMEMVPIGRIEDVTKKEHKKQ